MDISLTPQTTVADLTGLWLHHLRVEGRLERTTINEYERVLRQLVIPGVGASTISDLTTSRIDELLVVLGTGSLNPDPPGVIRDP